jgi:hypothetical protein
MEMCQHKFYIPIRPHACVHSRPMPEQEHNHTFLGMAKHSFVCVILRVCTDESNHIGMNHMVSKKETMSVGCKVKHSKW